MLRFFHLLVLIPMLVASVAAGDRSCRILFLGAPENAPEKLHLFDGTTSQEVELPRMNLSPVYRISAESTTLQLHPAPVPDPASASPGAPKAELAAAVVDSYLLVSSDPSNKYVPVRMQVIDAGSTVFKPGEMLWFNLTKNSVGGKVGGEQLSMTPNSRAILKAPAGGNEDYNVNLSFRQPGNERLHPLCETKWLHDPRSRTLVFVFGQDGTRTPRVVGFPDYRTSPEKTSTP
jgi:hypothetical protein